MGVASQWTHVGPRPASASAVLAVETSSALCPGPRARVLSWLPDPANRSGFNRRPLGSASLTPTALGPCSLPPVPPPPRPDAAAPVITREWELREVGPPRGLSCPAGSGHTAGAGQWPGPWGTGCVWIVKESFSPGPLFNQLLQCGPAEAFVERPSLVIQWVIQPVSDHRVLGAR